MITANMFPVTLSKFENVGMQAIFVNNQLAAVCMNGSWHTSSTFDMEEVDYLYQALCIVYGEADATQSIPRNVRKLMTKSSDKVLYGWQPAADTYIALTDTDGAVDLYYFNTNVDFMAEMQSVAPAPINTFGL